MLKSHVVMAIQKKHPIPKSSILLGHKQVKNAESWNSMKKHWLSGLHSLYE